MLKDAWSDAWDSLKEFNLKRATLRDQNARLIGKVFIKAKELQRYEKYLAEARIEIDTLRNVNKALNLIIKEYVREKVYVYKCPHCGFEGREYRDFCPGCDKDQKGNTAINYKTGSCNK